MGGRGDGAEADEADSTNTAGRVSQRPGLAPSFTPAMTPEEEEEEDRLRRRFPAGDLMATRGIRELLPTGSHGTVAQYFHKHLEHEKQGIEHGLVTNKRLEAASPTSSIHRKMWLLDVRHHWRYEWTFGGTCVRKTKNFPLRFLPSFRKASRDLGLVQ